MLKEPLGGPLNQETEPLIDRLNVAEVELNVMTRQCLNRRNDSLEVLRDEVAA